MTSLPRGGGSLEETDRRPGLARSVRSDDEFVYVTLEDGREFAYPLTDRLKAATPAQRANWVIEDFGTAIHWPDIDEDIGVAHVIGITEHELYQWAGWRTWTSEELDGPEESG